MEEHRLGDLRADLSRDGERAVVVRFSGRSASREPMDVLAPLFARLLAIATAERRAVVLRFEALEYFNSSTIAALVQFIRQAQQVGVGLEIVYDGRQRWQALSFDALRRALRPLEDAGGGPPVAFRDG